MKRILSFTLALVMAIGLAAFPAAAADFKDDKAVKYNEAVDVVSAAGIINGFEDGTFQPEGNLTREQAAKIVAYMRLGKDADSIKATSSAFKDVAVTRWSAGYISYCVSEGIIAGMGDGTFAPTANVTGYQFAKMLLTALGYDADIEGYTGSQWAVNVAKTALDIELFDGNDGANYSAPATRQEAALYVLNTLKADLVEYDQKGTTVIVSGGVTVNTGASEATAVTSAKASGSIYSEHTTAGGPSAADPDIVQFAERYVKKLELTVGADAFGRPAKEWRYDKKDVGTFAKEPELTYTGAVKGADIYKALGKPAGNTRYTYYVNGVQIGAAAATNGALFPGLSNTLRTQDVSLANNAGFRGINADETSYKMGGNGVLLEIYEDDANATAAADAYIVSFVITYVGEITNWKAASGSQDEYVNIGVPDGAIAPATLGSGKFETTAFSDDDADDNTIVYYTFSAAAGEREIKSAAAAKVVTGIVTRAADGDGFTMGGKTYKYNKIADNAANYVAYDDDQEDQIKVYLDPYGYVLYSDSVSGGNKDVVLLLAINRSTSYGKVTYKAKAVFPGDTAMTEITFKDNAANNAVLATLYANFTGGLDGAIIGYTKSSGKYLIADMDGAAGITYADVTELSALNALPAGTTEAIKTSRASMYIRANGAATVSGNSDTQFLFVKTDNEVDDYKYTVYTGIKNVPVVKAKAATQVAYTMDSEGKFAEFVVVFDGKSASSSTDQLIFVQGVTVSKSTEDTGHSDPYRTVKGYVLGSSSAANLEVDAGMFADNGNRLDADRLTDISYFDRIFVVNGYYITDGVIDDWDELDPTDYTAVTSDAAVNQLRYNKGNLVVSKGATMNTLVETQYGIANGAAAYIYNNIDKTANATSITSIRRNAADETYNFLIILNDDEQVVGVFINDKANAYVDPDQLAADAVTAQITALPAVITVGDAAVITAARTAYDGLTAAQQALVTNLATLTAAEAALAAAQDQAAADAVTAQITALPAPGAIVAADGPAITAARTAYDGLTAAQQALVTNLATLTAAEAALAAAQDQAAADAVTGQITALPAPGAIVAADGPAITAARTAYDGLTAAQQALVTNLATLEAAEAAYAAL